MIELGDRVHREDDERHGTVVLHGAQDLNRSPIAPYSIVRWENGDQSIEPDGNLILIAKALSLPSLPFDPNPRKGE